MKYIIALFLILNNLISSSQNTYDYLGTIILENNKPMSFKLHIIEEKGIVHGSSLTNIGLEDETKSEISGLYFKSDKSFQLKEEKILYTNSEAPLNTFCHISMNLSFNTRIWGKHLSGNFTGNLLDSTECDKGKIILIKEEKIKKKIKKIKKIIDNNKSSLQQTRILKNGDDFTIKWEGKKIILFIWDGNKEDGDKIQLKINNDIILNDFETKNKKKKIKYKIHKGKNIIEILASNEGKLSPNTSRIELVDKENKYVIIAQLELGKSVFINIIK